MKFDLITVTTELRSMQDGQRGRSKTLFILQADCGQSNLGVKFIF